MKKLLLFLFALPLFTYAQHKSCCSVSSTQKFAQLASNDKFAAAHEAPVPFSFTSDKGSMVTYKATDGKETTSFQINSANKSDNWLIVFHEWWGLNDYIKKEAEIFSKDLPNVNIIAVDLYDGYVAASPEEAREKMSALKDERSRAIIQGTINHIGKNAKIGTIGWCMGGAWSLQASIMTGKQGAGCVMYYGMPESDVEKLKELNGSVLGIFAKRDEWITPKVVDIFEQKMREANKELTIKFYDADHAFANPSNPNHDVEATEDARVLSLSFFKDKLK